MQNKNIFIITGIVVVLGIILFASFGNEAKIQSIDSENLISQNGIHWHPELTIYKNGEKIELPSDIGLGTTHNPIHTHDEDAASGVLHLEFNGLVYQKDTKLSEFFKVWNKDINSFGSNMTMTVNGIASNEFGDYLMKDGDKIELIYE